MPNSRNFSCSSQCSFIYCLIARLEHLWFPAMGTVTCACGACELWLAHPPILRLECCCVDCRASIAQCTAAAGCPPPACEPVDVVYFPNRLRVEVVQVKRPDLGRLGSV